MTVFRRRLLYIALPLALFGVLTGAYLWWEAYCTFGGRLRRYQAALARCSTSEEKLEATRRVWPGGVLRDPDRHMTMDEQVRLAICGPAPVSEAWLRYYQEVIRLATWEVSDLERLSKGIGEATSPHWKEQFLGGRAYCAIESSTDELARGWLKVLTAEDFCDIEQFERRLAANRSALTWDPKEGRFVVRR